MKKRGQAFTLILIIVIVIIVVVILALIFIKPLMTKEAETTPLATESKLPLEIKDWQEEEDVDVTVQANDENKEITSITFQLITNQANCTVKKEFSPIQPLETRVLILQSNCNNIIDIKIISAETNEIDQPIETNQTADTSQTNQTCTDTCSSLGYECGTYTICEVNTNCGICSKEYTCSAGSCIWAGNETNLTCTDTDITEYGGIDYYVKGTTSNSTDSSTDYCLSNITLIEYFCAGAEEISQRYLISSHSFDCLYGCKEGACLLGIKNCIDTDGGKDPYTKGTISNDTYSAEDLCDNNQLKEWFCGINGEINQETWDCASGCSNGACSALAN